MTIQEIKQLALEYGAGCLQAEVAGFCSFFHLENVYIQYEMEGNKCHIQLNDHEEIFPICTMEFKDVAMAVRFPGGLVNNTLDKLKLKYNLKDPGVVSVPLAPESEEK